VVFTSYDTLDSVDANVKCYFTDEDNPSAPSSKSNLDGRSLTSAIDWTNLDEWVDNRVYTTPDLSLILQTVMDRNGWVNGNSVLFVMNDDSSPSNRHRMFSAIEFLSGAEKAELRISWEPARQIERIDFTPDPGAYGIDVDVTIDAYPTGCSIYYTLDGSDPDQNSTLYTTPLPLTTSEYNYHIRARAYKQYWLPSEIYDGYYFTTKFIWSETILGTGTDRMGSCSIKVDSNDKPHIAFLRFDASENKGYVYYTNKISGSWSSLEEVYEMNSDSYTLLVIDEVELLLDSGDNPIIFFSDDGDFVRAEKNGGSWSVESPISAFSSYTVADFDARIMNDIEHVIFIHWGGIYPLYYSYKNGGSWSTAQVTNNVLYGFTVDGNDKVHIAYVTGEYFYYKTNKTGSWVTESWLHHPANSSIKFFGTPFIGLDVDGNPEIMMSGNLYHPDAQCSGIGRYNSELAVYTKDDQGDWQITKHLDAGGTRYYTGDCDNYANKYSNYDMEYFSIGTNYIPTYFQHYYGYSSLARGYGTDFSIEIPTARYAGIVVDSGNNNQFVWVVNDVVGADDDYYIKYGTTNIETRTFL
jgi:hypothetical protein